MVHLRLAEHRRGTDGPPDMLVGLCAHCCGWATAHHGRSATSGCCVNNNSIKMRGKYFMLKE